MNHSNLIIYIFEMIGTVAFASSGALVGINLRKKLRAVNGKEYIEAVWGIGFKMKEE